MSAHDHAPVEVDPAALQHARYVWSGFTSLIKYGLAAIVVVLLGMAVFLT